jgi:hypothetical protein
MSYVDVFSGNTIQPANKSYNVINLDQNITLSWPTQFLDTGNVVASWMDINATVLGRTLTLPDARLASNGQQIVIVNTGNQTFNLLKNDGNVLLQNIATGTAVCICLFDNSTSAGEWRSIPFGQGQTAVSQVAATAPARGFTIAGSPITNNGTFVFALANMLAALEQLAAVGNKGFIVQKGDSQLVIRKIESDDANVVVENQDGDADDIKIKLNPNGLELISALLGNIKISGNSIASNDQDGDIILSPNGNGSVKSTKNFQLSSGKTLSLNNNDNTFSVSLRNPNGTQNLVFDLPVAHGADNSIMQTSAVGQLSFSPLTTVVANKQQMESGNSQINPIIPNNLIYARSSCKAWGVFNGKSQDNPIIPISSNNILLITRNGVGSYTLTVSFSFNSPMVISGNAFQDDAFALEKAALINFRQISGNQFYIFTMNRGATAFVDYDRVSFAVFGDLV